MKTKKKQPSHKPPIGAANVPATPTAQAAASISDRRDSFFTKKKKKKKKMVTE